MKLERVAQQTDAALKVALERNGLPDYGGKRTEFVAAGTDRYWIHMPFMFRDGDHPCIILKRGFARESISSRHPDTPLPAENSWYLGDEGHTVVRLGSPWCKPRPDWVAGFWIAARRYGIMVTTEGECLMGLGEEPLDDERLSIALLRFLSFLSDVEVLASPGGSQDERRECHFGDVPQTHVSAKP